MSLNRYDLFRQVLSNPMDRLLDIESIEQKFPTSDQQPTPTSYVPQMPLTLEGYVDFIVRQSQRKKWSTDPNFLGKCIFKEAVELIDALEQGKPDDEIGAEAADVMYFVWQLVKTQRPGVNLDGALLAKMQDNEIKKKKTIDENGKMVRR